MGLYFFFVGSYEEEAKPGEKQGFERGAFMFNSRTYAAQVRI